MVLEAGIDGESLIASVTRKSYFPLVPSHRCPFFENGTIPSVQFLRSWPSGKGWLMSLFSTLDGLVWRQLTNAPAFSAFPSPEKLSKTLKRPHVLLVRTRYQVPTKSARSFFLLRRSVPVFYRPLFWSTKIAPKITEIFTNRNKRIRPVRCKAPYQAPPLKCRHTHT